MEKEIIKKIDHQETIRKIAQNYEQLECSIVSQLRLSCDHHYVTIGSFREEVWQSLFEQIVPKKFSIERSVFIIDSNGQVSKEVDLIIFDEQYTPYIFNYGKIKYIPIEAVAVVVQCKSTHLNFKQIDGWVKSIEKLKTSGESIARMYSDVVCGQHALNAAQQKNTIISEKSNTTERPTLFTQTSTKPIYILCHMDKSDSGHNATLKLFDIVICPEKDRLRTIVKSGSLSSWYEQLNHADRQYERTVKKMDASIGDVTLEQYRVGYWEIGEDSNKTKSATDGSKNMKKEISLLSLIFQLNQLLMLVNNPMLFPHQAYVKMFNNCINETGEK
ncbi:DUF6602 domain-containing protein [Paenibacillus sp. 1001270B_150601_E10]|uniref:DUF6602 domain-containing protein n=1 Tax=Paenibacillus sp. 1001270B_150601_E10 TaxID=2787079 RepID=UPI00189F54C5|nr:DUF6602 domain-containing protein [Paenibacillus sp. 1001270B_150601_E10]